MMSMRLYDNLGNVTSTNSVINVSELPDFQKMYLADVETAAELTSDLYGVPMLIERTGEYQYKPNTTTRRQAPVCASFRRLPILSLSASVSTRALVCLQATRAWLSLSFSIRWATTR